MANDPEAAVREDTARRLAELLDRPGVTSALITDLLDSNNVDSVNHETNLDHAIHEGGHARTMPEDARPRGPEREAPSSPSASKTPGEMTTTMAVSSIENVTQMTHSRQK